MSAVLGAGTDARERRIEHVRRVVELFLDRVMGPGGWAASVAYHAGLQGRIRTSTSTFELPRRASHASRPPLRIGFASDFHAGAETHPKTLTAAFEALEALRPDVLLLGGDFVSARAEYIHRVAPALAAIPAPYGKFAVFGNHDLRTQIGSVIAALEGAGVQMVSNRHVTLAAPFDDITICGLDDTTNGLPRADLALDGVGATRIVLMHSPDGLEAIEHREFELALCGHTHGGQIALPSGRPLFVPGGHVNRRYFAGRFDIDGPTPRTLLVSRGVGCSTVPVRLFSAPEVHLCLIT